jgi:hypothetical protein
LGILVATPFYIVIYGVRKLLGYLRAKYKEESGQGGVTAVTSSGMEEMLK